MASLSAPAAPAGCDIAVREHSWGSDASALHPPFDVVAACDVMYIEALAQLLVASLVALSGPQTRIYISHGRNRQVWLGTGGGWGGLPDVGAGLREAPRTNAAASHATPHPDPCALTVFVSQAEPEFLRVAAAHFDVARVPAAQLDALYQCSDVDVLELTPKSQGSAAGSGQDSQGEEGR